MNCPFKRTKPEASRNGTIKKMKTIFLKDRLNRKLDYPFANYRAKKIENYC